MVEQAAADRVLFLNESRRPIPDLRFPEYVTNNYCRYGDCRLIKDFGNRQFNTGSPWNVPAGHGSVNIDKVIAKYQKEAFEENERKMEQLQADRVPAEQPVDRLIRRAPAPSN